MKKYSLFLNILLISSRLDPDLESACGFATLKREVTCTPPPGSRGRGCSPPRSHSSEKRKTIKYAAKRTLLRSTDGNCVQNRGQLCKRKISKEIGVIKLDYLCLPSVPSPKLFITDPDSEPQDENQEFRILLLPSFSEKKVINLG
jgi:hypothetical protein